MELEYIPGNIIIIKVFYKYINDMGKNSSNIPDVSTEEYNFMDIVNKFVTYMKSNK